VRSLAPLSPGNHHIDLSAAAFGADQPLPPFREGHLGAVAFGLLAGIGLDLVLAHLAPDDEAHTSLGSAAERHRRAAIGFQRLPRRLAAVARGGAKCFGAGNGSRIGSGRILYEFL
jgi:hypothetical protein